MAGQRSGIELDQASEDPDTVDDIEFSPFFIGEDECKRQLYSTYVSR
jgi:hypothetical protein